MQDRTPTDLATLFGEHMRQTHHDRRAQTAEFRQVIGELRNDIRVLGVLALLGILALAGIQVTTPTVKLTPAVAMVETP
jgi:hypothetical protein